MPVAYGLTMENRFDINLKAKSKKDGVYQFRGVSYRVRSGRADLLAHNGQILQPFGNFDVEVGKYTRGHDEAKKLMEKAP